MAHKITKMAPANAYIHLMPVEFEFCHGENAVTQQLAGMFVEVYDESCELVGNDGNCDWDIGLQKEYFDNIA